jgi:hypothetical protein
VAVAVVVGGLGGEGAGGWEVDAGVEGEVVKGD